MFTSCSFWNLSPNKIVLELKKMKEIEEKLIASCGDVERNILTDDREANSKMVNEICDRMRAGCWVAFDRKYYRPLDLFWFVCDVNNKFPNLMNLDAVYDYVRQYSEWVNGATEEAVKNLVAELDKKD